RFFPFRSAPFVCGNGEPADEDTPFTQNILLETDEFQVGWMRLLAGAKKERTLVQRGCMIILVHRGTPLVNLKGMEDRDEEEFFEVCEGTMFTVPAHNNYMFKNRSEDTVVLHYVFLARSDALDPSQARSVFEDKIEEEKS
ncbi:unnamed protein product, partial [Cyprideis torosa]